MESPINEAAMEKLLENRWVEFMAGVGVLLIAYLDSPQTAAVKIAAIAGSFLAGLVLVVSWRQEHQADGRKGKKA